MARTIPPLINHYGRRLLNGHGRVAVWDLKNNRSWCMLSRNPARKEESVSYKTNRAWRRRHPERWRAQKERCNARYYARYRRGARNKRKTWSLTELFTILTSRKTDPELAKILGRTVHSIQSTRSKARAVETRLTRNRRVVVRPLRKWTKGEVRLITAPKRPSDRVLAERLGRSLTSVRRKRQKMSKRRKKRG